MKTFFLGLVLGIALTILLYAPAKVQIDLRKFKDRTLLISEILDSEMGSSQLEDQLYTLAKMKYNYRKLGTSAETGLVLELEKSTSNLKQHPTKEIKILIDEFIELKKQRFATMTNHELIEYRRFLNSHIREKIFEQESANSNRQNQIQEKFNSVYSGELDKVSRP